MTTLLPAPKTIFAKPSTGLLDAGASGIVKVSMISQMPALSLSGVFAKVLVQYTAPIA